MKTKTLLLTAALSCLLNAHAAEGTEAPSGTSAEPDVVTKTGNAIEHGAKKTVEAVEHGARAAGRGIKKGAKVVAEGVEHGAHAVGNAAGHVAQKVGGEHKEAEASTDAGKQ